MSAPGLYAIECDCGAQLEAELWDTINLSLDPTFLEEILDEQLNVVECPQCGQELQIEKDLVVQDLAANVLVVVLPPGEADREKEVVEQLSETLADVEEDTWPEVLVLEGLEALRAWVEEQYGEELK